MKTLPKLSEYVDLRPMTSTFDTEQSDWYYKEVQLLDEIRNYTNFLNQPLNLSHFIPAIEKDGKWIVLEEPKSDFKYVKGSHGYDLELEYQTALENVVFKGFYMNDKDDTGFGVLTDNLDSFWIRNNSTRTIEDFLIYNLEVNETIIKKFNL